MDYGWKTIIGKVPAKANRYRVIRKGDSSSLAKDDVLKDYERTFYMQCSAPYRNLEITRLFEFHARVYYPTMSPDIDNSLKVLLDCLQYTKTIRNDNLCVKVVAEKFVDKSNPRVEFRIVTIE
jgi:Holliday junction resolvase RusA-like endonuclease